MRLTHPDYTRLVVQACNAKRANNELSLLLAQPTPANIRQACLHVYKEQYDKKEHQVLRKDEQVLRDFFGPGEHGKQFLESIRGFPTDKLRPLDNYLKGNTEKTDTINLELLAWLINFQHRPYSYDKNFQLTDEESYFLAHNGEKLAEPAQEVGVLPTKLEEPGELLEGLDEEQASKEMEVSMKNDTTKNNYKKAALIFLMLIICTGGIYAIWQQKQGTVCVYWASDHYQQVPCNEETQGRLIITMDREKVKSFRKITRKDTITEWSIGKIYYIKDSDTIKCYTNAGLYPENLNRTLKVLSSYIFENHLRKKEAPGKDSLAGQNTKALDNK